MSGSDPHPPPDSSSPSDDAAALAEADPQERALDRLVDLLAAAGVTAGEAESLQALEADLEGDDPVDNARPRASRRRTRPARHADVADSVGGADEIEVVVADDRMTATIVHLDKSATLHRVARALQKARVRHGIAVDAIKAAVARARAGEAQADVVAARGSPAEAGVDGRFTWEVETGRRAGAILDDGSIDLRDRRLIIVVQEGQCLGHLHPAREGTPGCDVTGRALAPPAAVALHLVPGAHVRTEDAEEGVVACYSEGEGGVAHEESTTKGKRRLKIWLTKVWRIEQDVDYATGHVDFDGEVVVSGSVKALFRVRASGSVSIEGNVEAGARIESGGDITIGGGVVGDETELIARGRVMAKFLQGCQVRAGGDVEIGAYVFEADLRCRGRLTVAGMGEGSGRALVGGLVWAAGGIETPSLGSPSNPRIHLVLGVDPDIVDEMERLRHRLRIAQTRRQRLLDDLGLERLDGAAIKALLRQTADAEERAARVRTVKELTKIGAALQHGRERLAELRVEQQAPAAQADLLVSGPVFPGPELRLGEHQMRIDDETRARRYRLVEEEGEVSIHVQEA